MSEWQHPIPEQIMDCYWNKTVTQYWVNTRVTINHKVLRVPRVKGNTARDMAVTNTDPRLHNGEYIAPVGLEHRPCGVMCIRVCVCVWPAVFVCLGGWLDHILVKGSAICHTHVMNRLSFSRIQEMSHADSFIHRSDNAHTDTHIFTHLLYCYSCVFPRAGVDIFVSSEKSTRIHPKLKQV